MLLELFMDRLVVMMGRGKSLPGAVVLLLMSTGAGVAADFTIVGSGATHALTQSVDRTALDWPITVRRNDNGAQPSEVCLDVTPLLGPSMQAATQQRLVAAAGQLGDRPCFKLPALGQGTAHLTGKLPVEGEYKAQLGLVADNVRTPYDIALTRTKPGIKLGVVGAGTDGKLALTSDRSTVVWPVVIRRDDSLPDDAAVTFGVSPFAGPSATIVAPALLRDGKPLTGSVTLAGLRELPLTLNLKAELEGAYKGEITYEVGGTRTAIPMELTRTRPDFDLKVDAISKRRGTLWGDVTLQAQLQNVTGVPREVFLPTISRLERVDTSGTTPVDVGAGAIKLSYALMNGEPAMQPLRIAGDAGMGLLVTVGGLDAPGTYKGVMRFTAPDRKPLDAVFELALRLPGWLAGIVIGLGVVVAAAARYFLQTAQPRLLLQRQAIALRANLEKLAQNEKHDLASAEADVIAFLVREVDGASDDLADRAAAAATIEARIGRVAAKVPLLELLIGTRRRLDRVRPLSVADALRPELDPSITTLETAVPADNEIATRITELAAIPGRITERLRAHIQTAAQALRTAIDAAVNPLEYEPVRLLLRELDVAVAGPALEPALALLDRARLQYIDIAVDSLRRKLDPTTAALGFQADKWANFVADIGVRLDAVKDEADPEQKVRSWNGVNTYYLVQVVLHAKTRIDALVAAKAVPAAIPALEAAAIKLAAAQTALVANDLAAANKAYGEAMQEVDKARSTMEVNKQTMGSAAGREGSAPAAGGSVLSSVVDEAIGSLLPLPLGRGATAAMINRALLLFTLWFSGAMLLIAVVTGLQLLYVPNPAFGCWDLVVAFLWGAGLHAVGGQTFQGLQGFAQQFR